MAFPSIFEASTTEVSLNRLANLTNETKPLWGKMNAAQVLAHLNVSYDAAYGKIDLRPSFMMKLMMKLFIKKVIVGEKPYKSNSPTAKEFIISDVRDFEKEKALLIANITETEKHGKAYFEGKVSSSMGALTSNEWDIMFYKHMDHHFKQFGI